MKPAGKKMAIYQYIAIEDACEYCRNGFEVLQSMGAKPLTVCPRCQKRVKKVPSLCSGFSPLLSDGNLRDHGFTKLVNKGNGTFEKTV